VLWGRVQGSWVQDAGCRVQGAGCRVQGAGFRVQRNSGDSLSGVVTTELTVFQSENARDKYLKRQTSRRRGKT